MKLIDTVQGTDQWHAERAKHFTASEAPVMMGDSAKLRRNELLHMKATGSERDYSEWVQKNLFDKGHAYEASMRPIIERLIDDDLFPATATDDEGWLLASFDGITMARDTLYEHKMWNETLAQAVRDKDLPAEYYWQLEQQLLVAKARRVIFVVSDGTEKNMVWMEYTPVPGRAEKLVAGWRLFEEDLANYVPQEAKPVAVGRTPENLPAVVVKVRGEVVASNLDEFKAHALDVIHSINRELVTDQHFADAEKTVKWCEKVEQSIAQAKAQALGQTKTIEQLFLDLDEIAAEARTARLELDKLVKAQKEARRLQIKKGAEDAFAAHVATINNRLARVTLPPIHADFASVMKGKRTIDTLQNAADTELARLKLQANEIAEKIEINLASLRELANGHVHLFRDAQLLVQKDNEDLVLLIRARINEFEEAEEKRREEERERIRAEERERIEQENAEAAAAAVAAAAEVPVSTPVAEPEPIAEALPVEPIAEQSVSRPLSRPAPAATTPKVAQAFRAEVIDLAALVQAVADGLAPLSVLQVDQSILDELVRAQGARFAVPGVRLSSPVAAAS